MGIYKRKAQDTVSRISQSRTSQKTKRKPNTHYDTEKILELGKTNLTHQEIADMTDVERSTVSKVLQKYNLEKKDIDDYIAQRPQILAGLQERVLKSITDEDIKKAPIAARTILYGTLYDKERIERGLSTDNIGIIGKLVHEIKSMEQDE